jgi:hypothetical protein
VGRGRKSWQRGSTEARRSLAEHKPSSTIAEQVGEHHNRRSTLVDAQAAGHHSTPAAAAFHHTGYTVGQARPDTSFRIRLVWHCPKFLDSHCSSGPFLSRRIGPRWAEDWGQRRPHHPGVGSFGAVGRPTWREQRAGREQQDRQARKQCPRGLCFPGTTRDERGRRFRWWKRVPSL